MPLTRCGIEGHYYKVDLGNRQIEYDAGIKELEAIGAVFYVKCVRCGHRILINDKTYEMRQKGEYVL